MTRTAKPRSVSFNDADWKAIRADAERVGLSASAYLRTLWLAARPRLKAGPWLLRGGDVWMRDGDAWSVASSTGWHASAGGDVTYAAGDDVKANRAAADAWLRSRGVVLA